ncbi:MAG: PCRF domain-containing protein, partial [Candidatus Aminicenantales bacterium]
MEAIDKELSSPDIWKDQKKYQSLQQNKKRLEREISLFSKIKELKEDIEVFVELAEEGEKVEEELKEALASFDEALERAELQALFSE